MRDKEEFYDILTEVHGHPFAEYNQLVGDFDFTRFVVKVHQVPPEAEGQPVLFVVRVPQFVAAFPPHLFNSPVRRTALEDLLTRELGTQLESLARYNGDGIARRSLQVAMPGQKILPRTSVLLTPDYVEARIHVQLPSRDGLIAGDEAKGIFFDDLPEVVRQSMLYCNLDEEGVEEFVNMMEDADQVRQVLPTRGWVGFVGEGALLARVAETDLPDYERLDLLDLPEGLISEVEVPNQGQVRGLGIPSGITLVIGDEFSGRTELLHAVADGIYNHVPGDGRERVIAVPDAVYIRAESGRSVRKVDISPFVDGPDAALYTSETASASCSQAAALAEALEVGAHALLLDESDSAPGFLVRDSRLESLLGEEAGGVVPLAARVRRMADELGISFVIGGSTLVAEFIPVADTIYRVKNHALEEVTEQAKALAVRVPSTAEMTGELSEWVEHSRWVVPSSIDASAGRHDTVIEAKGKHTLRFGRAVVDLSGVRQLADVHQTTTIGLVMAYARSRYMEEGRPLREMLDLIDRDLSTEGLECLTRDMRGDLTRPRRYEVAAALNRLETLRVTRPED